MSEEQRPATLLGMVGRVAAIFALCLGLPLAMLLAFGSSTARGHGLGAAGLALATGLLLLLYSRRRRVAAASITVAFGIVVWLAATIPANAPSAGFDGDPIAGGFWQIIPEVDQIELGLSIVPMLDPFIDKEQARRLAAVTLPIYQEMPDHPRTALAYGYAEAFGGAPDDDHMYWSRPDRDGAPILIFLHGAAGNFASYPRVFQALDAVVVCPTLGFGLYQNEARTEAAVARARKLAVEKLDGNPSRVFLAGLSQGGVGASTIGAGATWARGVILISPVIDHAAIRRWTGPELLVLHGEADRRIPLRYVKENIAATTATVTAKYYPDEDHFLLYSKRAEMIETIGRWIAER